jgi:hypothetical protein
MTEQRPRPQYGEYATPEEQLAAMGAQPAAQPVPHPVARPEMPPGVSSTAGAGTGAATGAASASAPVAPRPWDLSLTVFLLALNAFLVLTSIPDWLNLSATLATGYEQLGYGDYTSTELANSIGLGIVAIQVGLLITVLYVAVTRLRAQRRAFPITLGLGILGVVLTITLLMVAMTSDPALAAYIATQTSQSGQ